MASSSDSDDDGFMAVDAEEAAVEGTMEQEDEPHAELEVEEPRPSSRSMLELPEEVLEYILSFLSPYQEHKTAALVCKQWYRLIKGVAHQCYHGFIKAVQEGNIQWESRTYPYPGTPITQRFSHSACYYDPNQSMYVFGGCTQSSCNAAFNDLWRLDLNSKEWIRPLASGSYPSPKAGATLVVYKDLLVLFGGWTRPSPYPLHQPERFFDEIHTYSPSKNWWNCIMTTHGPPPMAGHSSCVIEDKMIVFGGSLGSRQMSNDVWVLDLEQWAWSKPSISGPSPHPRGGQSQIVIDNETILILGGCGGPNALFKDAWLLHMQANPWTWQPLKVENEDHGAPELWCHPACRVWTRGVPAPSHTPLPLYSLPKMFRNCFSPAPRLLLMSVPCSPSGGTVRRGLQPSSQRESPAEPQPHGTQGEGHSLPPIARRLGHHPPQSLNVGKPLYQSMNCKPMQMYVLDIKDTKEQGRVKWKVFNSSSVVGPPETSLHTVVQGRGELIIFGGLMDKKQNVKYYPKTNALYFVRAKR
ncbi:FBX42 protein, partial [Quiscalus mexicanus]|nr:FBX42 protein [Quiscalus mexicanus]